MKELFFLANNLIILLLYFSVKIFEIIGGDIADYFYITIYREFRGLAIFLKYNFIIFYLN